MPNPKEFAGLPEILSYIPPWRKGDPGPDWPWIIQEVDPEIRVQLVVSQLEYEKEVVAAQARAIDRNIAILKGTGATKR
jgi:hypothetical protein